MALRPLRTSRVFTGILSLCCAVLRAPLGPNVASFPHKATLSEARQEILAELSGKRNGPLQADVLRFLGCPVLKDERNKGCIEAAFDILDLSAHVKHKLPSRYRGVVS